MFRCIWHLFIFRHVFIIKMNIFPAPSAILPSFKTLRFSLSSESRAIFYDSEALKYFSRWKAKWMSERERSLIFEVSIIVGW